MSRARGFAKRTKVSVEQTRREIERTLERYGASGFGYAWDRHEEAVNPPVIGGPKVELREYATISFRFKSRMVRLDIPMPTQREVKTVKRIEQAMRQRWRAALLVVKAKLEAVDSGISTLDAEFLANIVTESGMTVGQIILPQMSEAVRSGRLLPPARGDS